MADPRLEAWLVQMGNKHGWTKVVFKEPEKVKVSKEDMDAFDQYKGKVDTMVRTRLNELKIVGLAESAAVTAAIAQITNQASFASEFEATVDYKKALAEAFIGGWHGAAEKATSAALSKMALPEIAGPMFKFLETLEKEHARALAAAGEKTVKDFLNKALNAVVVQLSKQIQGLGRDSEVVKACIAGAHERALTFYEEDKASPGKPQKRESKLVAFCDELQDALGKVANIGTLDVAATHQAALDALITGLTAKGWIDFGIVYVDTELVSDTPAGQTFKQKGGVEFQDGKIPRLCGTAKNERFANAISDYLAAIGGTVNDLDIEKRVHFKLRMAGSGPFSFLTGHTMDGHAKWRKGAPSGITVDGGDLLSVVKGQIPKDYIRETQLAFASLVKDQLTATKVTA